MPSGVYERPSAEERFWKYVNKETGSDCWEWTGSAHNGGYSQIGINGKMISVHRFSYELHKGPIPEGKVVMHSCDNRKCVNPEHLSIGTQAENVQDMINKNRKFSKLNEFQVKEIKNKLNLGMKQDEIAKEYAVSQSLISSIKTGKHLLHINV